MPPPITANEQLNKKDLQLILEVNRKAIEVETGVADQNEEIIEYLEASKTALINVHDKLDAHIKINGDKSDKIIKQNEDLAKEVFKMQVLFITGLLSLVIQIVQIFLKK